LLRAPVLAAAGGLLLAAALQDCAWFERAEGLLFDGQVRLLRAVQAQGTATPPDRQVVIVGIDGATLERAGVPLAMLHRPLGAALDRISQAGARAIAIDLVLPERPVDRWMPGADEALAGALARAGRRCAVVFVVEPDAGGGLRPPYTPFAAALGEGALVTALLPVDGDGVVRRFDPGLSAPGVPTLAGELARRLALPGGAPPGWIDYSRGAAFGYVPLEALADPAAAEQGARWRRLFEGRVVMLGSVLPYVDSIAQPASLVGWDYPRAAPPAIVIHAQLLRSLLGRGLIRPVPGVVAAAVMAALALLGALPGAAWRWLALAAALASLVSSATLMHALGWRLAAVAPLAAGVFAAAIRTAADLSAAQRERRRLSGTFAGYVSPQVLQAILDGRLDTGCGRRALAFVFADLRGFTAWSEAAPAEQVFELLNRYFAQLTPLIHRCGGTIDNFRGDGLMILFGAPDPHPDPCGGAFEAARAIVTCGRTLFRSDPRGDVRALDVAVGIAFGEAVVGDLGGPDRKDFTAIGDAVNVAARLQDLSKSLDCPVLMTMQVFDRLASVRDPGMRPLPMGEVALRGHTPVAIAGWRPPS
jgi:adenylate cyclase